MNKRRLSLAFIAVLVFCSMAWARNSKTVFFKTEVTMGESKLTPGFYEVHWISHSPKATVTFSRIGHEPVTTEATWVERGTKYPVDTVLYTNNPDGSHTLLELRLAGRTQALVFSTAQNSAAEPQLASR